VFVLKSFWKKEREGGFWNHGGGGGGAKLDDQWGRESSRGLTPPFPLPYRYQVFRAL